MASIAWSEIFRTDEDRPGHWVMYDDNKQPVAEIELRRTDVGPRYRITMGGTIMGWTTTLRSACEGAWARHVHAHDEVFRGPPRT